MSRLCNTACQLHRNCTGAAYTGRDCLDESKHDVLAVQNQRCRGRSREAVGKALFFVVQVESGQQIRRRRGTRNKELCAGTRGDVALQNRVGCVERSLVRCLELVSLWPRGVMDVVRYATLVGGFAGSGMT